jgi:hypothetical protein
MKASVYGKWCAGSARHFDRVNKYCYSAFICIYLTAILKAHMGRFLNTRKSAIIAAALAASLSASAPALADRQPCENYLHCAFVVTGAVAQLGVSNLKLTPVLVQALKAIETNDDAQLRSLLQRYPELSKGADRPLALNPRDDIENTFVMNDAKSQGGYVNSFLRDRNDAVLERDLRLWPERGELIDNGYVLLRRSAERGNLAVVAAVLNAGVSADAHASGALLYARNEAVARLLVARGAQPRDVKIWSCSASACRMVRPILRRKRKRRSRGYWT